MITYYDSSLTAQQIENALLLIRSAGAVNGMVKFDSNQGVTRAIPGTDYLNQHQDISYKENNTNKVTTVDANSTDTQYPSAKAVYTAVSNAQTTLNQSINAREETSHKTTTVNSSSTDTQYPSAKAVHTAVSAKEDSSHKTTTINSSSTDTQFPSAKAVYDFVMAAIQEALGE